MLCCPSWGSQDGPGIKVETEKYVNVTPVLCYQQAGNRTRNKGIQSTQTCKIFTANWKKKIRECLSVCVLAIMEIKCCSFKGTADEETRTWANLNRASNGFQRIHMVGFYSEASAHADVKSLRRRAQSEGWKPWQTESLGKCITRWLRWAVVGGAVKYTWCKWTKSKGKKIPASCFNGFVSGWLGLCSGHPEDGEINASLIWTLYAPFTFHVSASQA